MNVQLQSKLSTPVHPDEWKTRVELAACCRVFALLGWTEMIYNHITVRQMDRIDICYQN